MNKIKQLLKRGWFFDARQTDDGWYDVGFSHNTISQVEAINTNLNEAINECFDKAKKISIRHLQW